MPLYEYECLECGIRFERLQRKGDPLLQECPECCGAVRRLIQPPGIIFKGSGFYVTDNRRSNVGTQRDRSSKEADEGSSEKTSAKGETKPDDGFIS